MTTTTKQQPKTTGTHVRKGYADGRAARSARKVDENARKVAAINAKSEREEQSRREAIERLAKTTVAPSDNATERKKLMLIEDAALRAWEKSGRKGKRPNTPNRDAIIAGLPVMTITTKRKSSSDSAPRVEQTVIFYTGVTDFEGSRHNRLSAIAARNKMPAEQLRKLLSDAGISEPLTSRWQLTLSSGVVVGARMPSDARVAVKQPKSKQSTAKSTSPTAAKTTKKSTPASKRVVDGISGKPAAKSTARSTQGE